jgi:hypothetical protein
VLIFDLDVTAVVNLYVSERTAVKKLSVTMLFTFSNKIVSFSYRDFS